MNREKETERQEKRQREGERDTHISGVENPNIRPTVEVNETSNGPGLFGVRRDRAAEEGVTCFVTQGCTCC